MKFIKLFLSIVVVLNSSIAIAGNKDIGLDYNLEAGAQSYPLGGLVTAKAGYGIPLWESNSTDEELFWKYGYLRPNIEINTAGVLNRGAASLEFYPVAILGLVGGAGFSVRNSSYYSDFNCNDVLCNETLTYEFLRARLLGGYKSFLVSIMAKHEKFKSKNKIKPFYEEMSYLVGDIEGDDLKTLNVVAGIKLSDRWNLGVLAIFQNFIHSENNNSSMFVVGNYNEGFWQGSLGLGQYKSSHQESNCAAVVSVIYTGKKGLSLLD
ncbi:hypothetical protein AZI86_07815 [Bdellovibrio bacteriovorus]|uniref:Uncharacterized protein n=1 Tax=Bdellovibrio bacteriovorus TaxID=959 RepID=A0A150WR04_BDEBC|nr:hypothetical protein [Bdellovibrio bacteriovorus]KYG66923.1 hypothetical protein AZI86_07815 [Bdellovibrio bacteriovorus]